MRAIIISDIIIIINALCNLSSVAAHLHGSLLQICIYMTLPLLNIKKCQGKEEWVQCNYMIVQLDPTQMTVSSSSEEDIRSLLPKNTGQDFLGYNFINTHFLKIYLSVPQHYQFKLLDLPTGAPINSYYIVFTKETKLDYLVNIMNSMFTFLMFLPCFIQLSYFITEIYLFFMGIMKR